MTISEPLRNGHSPGCSGAAGVLRPDSAPSQTMDGRMQKACEPLAVIGMAFRFPQDASTDDDLWAMLMSKRNTMTEWPKDRVNVDAFYHPDTSRPDTISHRGGHFLSELPTSFDAPFFSITAAEAEAMDPQHRVALETTFHALENAGMPMEQLSGSRTSVHAGCFSDDYKAINTKTPETLPSYACTGLALSMLSNRISWFFDLQGASVSIDTACSSSMTAFDVACQGLRDGDADTAIVIGTNLMFGLDLSLNLSRMSFLSPDSTCYSFDHRANGYGRGEGVGVLIVKPLSAALRANDTIRAVVRSTGSNQDGRTPGITQPSAAAQERLIRDTYAKAGLDMAATRYVEAHGTGTAVGDPIEAMAIGSAFREHRSPSAPMYIGSVKSNIGHLEGASGIAGIVKTILCLENAIIVPNANFERINPGIDTDRLNISIAADAIPWPSRGLRRASISSFGFGGSNSHVVLDDAYNFLRLNGLQGKHRTVSEPPNISLVEYKHLSSMRIKPPQQHVPNGSPTKPMSKALLVFTAADQGGIERIGGVFHNTAHQFKNLAGHADESRYLNELAEVLSKRRSLLNWRSYAIVESLGELEQLSQKLSKPLKRQPNPKAGFVFTGQGAQYAGMARDLFRFPVFATSFKKSEMYMDQFGAPWSLIDELLKPATASRVNEPALSQPLCTAVQVGLIDLLQSLRIAPSFVVGHSSGEIAAAYAIGALSSESACRVAYFRGLCAGELLDSQATLGGMMSVGLSEEDFIPYFDQLRQEFRSTKVVVACVNSPASITVSGDSAQIDWLQCVLERKSIFARKLRVNIAYHSPRMEDIAGRYLHLMGRLDPGEPVQNVIMISSVTGNVVTPDELQNGQYWVSNMVRPVRFSTALAKACKGGKSKGNMRLLTTKTSISDIVEIGPHSALRAPIQDILRHDNIRKVEYMTALVRAASAEASLLDLVGNLFCKGYDIDVTQLSRSEGTGNCVALPNLPDYPFDHSRNYWREARSSKEGYRIREHARLDLLGSPAPDWNRLEARWTHVLRISEQAWIADHRIKGRVLYPAAGTIAMALEAANQLADRKRPIFSYVVRDVTFSKPITIPDNGGKEVQVVLRPVSNSSKDSSTWTFAVYGAENDGEWQEKSQGQVKIEYVRTEDSVDEGREARSRKSDDAIRMKLAQDRCDRQIDPEEFYSSFLQQADFSYGPSFRAITSIKSDNGHVAVADVKTYQWPDEERFDFPQAHIIHPTTLDGMFQTPFISVSKGLQITPPPTVPTRINYLRIRKEGASHPSLESVKVYVQAGFRTKQRLEADILAVDAVTGDTILSSRMEASAIDGGDDSPSGRGKAERPLCYELCWKPDIESMNTQALSTYCEVARPRQRVDDSQYYQNVDLLLMKSLSDAIQSLSDEQLNSMPAPLDRYISWALHCQERFLNGQFAHFRPSDPEWSHLSAPEHQSALMEAISCNGQGQFYSRVAAELPAILNGKVDALEFMFRDDLAGEFYQDVNENVIDYAPLGRYLDLLTHKHPSLKILEIGAGTGSSTNYMLDMLTSTTDRSALFTQYDYTDISPAFFETASQKYSNYGSRMQFHVLNIEKDPSAQGFETSNYDLVLAASVLHATKNLEQTMHHVRKLLKPGGKFIMLEVVRETMRTSFAFGLLPGWWMGEEANRRLRPYLFTAEWDALLRRTGFSGVELEIPDFSNEAFQEYSLLVSTAVGVPLQAPLSTPVSLLVPHTPFRSSLVHPLSSLLTSAGYTPTLLRFPSSISNMTGGNHISLLDLSSCEPFLSSPSEECFKALQQLLRSSNRMLWLTSIPSGSLTDPRVHLIDGLARTACTEYPDLAFTTLALEEIPELEESLNGEVEKIAEMVMRAFEDGLQRQSGINSMNEEGAVESNGHATKAGLEFEPEFRVRGGVVEISRVVPSNVEGTVVSRKDVVRDVQQEFGKGPALALTVGSLGLLDTLHFVEDLDVDMPMPSGHVEIEVQASGVNFRDVLTVLGQLEANFVGCECAGIVTRVGQGCELAVGDKVAGIFEGTYKTFARGPAGQVVKVPGSVDINEAAASMVVFTTAWYCLVETARLAKGESVLIHSAAGGTGQAAIQVAQYLGARVYVTVGSAEKKEFLMKTYNIPEENIFASRNLTFAQGILRATGGKGVDVILNSLSGESLLASWDCIAPCGRFVEIGKRDIMNRNDLPMWPFRNGCIFAAIDLLVTIAQRPAVIQDAAKNILRLMESKTFFIPQPFKVHSISEIQDVFRSFQSGNNYGKIALEMRKDDVVEARLKPSTTYQFDPSRTYVIAGGLGGIGRRIALWMARKGARNLILLSRSGINSQAARALVEELTVQKVTVHTPKCDITNIAALQQVLEDSARTLPPISGCIQATMVLKDSPLDTMPHSSWTAACSPKVHGTWSLHTVLPRGLCFFVCLSSISAIVGHGGQANYAAGNAFMDALALHRRAHGEAATSLNLGWVEEAGVVAENAELRARFAKTELGMPPVTLDELFALLDCACDPSAPLPAQVITGLGAPKGGLVAEAGVKELVPWLGKATFRLLVHAARSEGKDEGGLNGSGAGTDYTGLFRDAKDGEEAARVVAACMRERMSKALAVPAEEVDLSRPLHALGVDSLLGLELKNYLAKHFHADVAVFDIMGATSAEAASALIMKRSSLRSARAE